MFRHLVLAHAPHQPAGHRIQWIPNKMLSFRSLAARTVGKRTSARFCTSAQPTVLFTWGEGSDGQLGHAKFAKTSSGLMGSEYVQEVPRKLVKSKRFEKVSIGPHHTLAVTNTGDLYGWGKGFAGKDSQSNEPAPIVVPNVKFKHVACGYQHNAAVSVDGQVYTWGHGGSWFSGGGQLGHDSTRAEEHPRLIEAFKAYGAKAAQVSLGQQHSVILTDDGEVLCCGVGEYGRQGTGNTLDALVPTSLESLEDQDIVQVAAGQDHTLALTASGSIYSWGRNQSGQLGHSDSYIDIYSMEDFPRLIDAESINNGENEETLLRDGLKTEHSPRFQQVAAGSSRSAALTTDGLMYIWGARVGHQPKLIGKGMFNGMKVIKVACGGDLGKSAFAAITEDNSLWMVGDASSKLLGVPGLKGRQPVPVLVSSLANKVLDVSCGFGQHMAAFVKMAETDN